MNISLRESRLKDVTVKHGSKEDISNSLRKVYRLKYIMMSTIDTLIKVFSTALGQ